MLTTLIEKVSNRLCIKSYLQLSIISILAVTGPLVILTAGIWDAINHIQNSPEFFWSDPHIAVYTGVAMVAVASLFSVNLLIKNSIQWNSKTRITTSHNWFYNANCLWFW